MCSSDLTATHCSILQVTRVVLCVVGSVCVCVWRCVCGGGLLGKPCLALGSSKPSPRVPPAELGATLGSSGAVKPSCSRRVPGLETSRFGASTATAPTDPSRPKMLSNSPPLSRGHMPSCRIRYLQQEAAAEPVRCNGAPLHTRQKAGRIRKAGTHASLAAEPTVGEVARTSQIGQLGLLTHLAELQEARPCRSGCRWSSGRSSRNRRRWGRRRPGDGTPARPPAGAFADTDPAHSNDAQ